MKSDFHVHTGFSYDTDTVPESMVKRAIELGLDTICITDHVDADFPINPEGYVVDIDAYFKELRRLQEKYREEIDMRIGIELGLQPHLGPYYKEYVSQYPFEFVIGSLHIVKKVDPYVGDLFRGRIDREVYRETFEETLEAVKNISDFDVLGHIDYVVRYSNNKEEEYFWNEYLELIDEVLKHLIKSGKGIELNTASYKHALSFCHPHPGIIKRYRELGGKIITVGSDGHKPEHLAYEFHRVKDILLDCGFKYYTEFKERKPVFRSLV